MTKEGAEAARSLVLGNCGLRFLPKGTMWNRTHYPSAASLTRYRCTTTHRTAVGLMHDITIIHTPGIFIIIKWKYIQQVASLLRKDILSGSTLVRKPSD